LIRYTTKIENMMKSRKLFWSKEQKAAIRQADYLTAALGTGSIVMPLCYGACVLNENEPVHNILSDWFEIQISLNLQSIPYILGVTWGALNCASASFSMIILPLTYVWGSLIYGSSLTPRNLQVCRAKGRFQYKIETQSFGVLNEEKFVGMFKTQQLLNVLINEIISSILISFHHIAFMIILVGVSLLMITSPGMIWNAGPQIMVMGLSGIFVVAVLAFMECKKFGEIVDASEKFIFKSKSLANRRSPYRKFIISCRRLTINSAHPFYTVRRRTFLEFFHQYLDFLTTLLVSLK